MKAARQEPVPARTRRLRPRVRRTKEAGMTTSAGPDPADLDRVALDALGLVEDGMLLGLGTGRAAEAFIRRLGERVRGGLRIRGVPTSIRSDTLARELGIEVISLEEATSLDIAFDG